MERLEARTIAKNTLWLFGGQLIGRALRATIIIYAARVLGAASWGAFSYALSLAAFLTIFSDIGINALLTREGSKNPELRKKYLATAFFIKIVLVAVLVAATAFLAPRLTNIEEAIKLLPIIVFVFAFDSLRDLGSSMARALEKMQIEAGVGVFTNAVIVAVGFILLYLHPSSVSLAIAYALGTGAGFLAIFFVLRDYFGGLRRHFDKKLIKPILTNAWPFGLMGLMGAVMINTDVIMLGWMTSADEVGYYSAGQKIIQLLYVIPTLIAASFFPAFARIAKTIKGPHDPKDESHFRALFEKALTIIYLIGIPLTLICVILRIPILNIYGPEYAPGVMSFAILALTLVVVFPATLMSNAIFAHEKQKHLVSYVALGIFGNIFFNLLLIPVLGIEGSAISTLINQLIINVYLWRKLENVDHFSIFPKLKKIAVATFGMGALALILNYSGINFFATASLSFAAYIALLHRLGEPALRGFKDLFART